jgi:hypothetical protein
VTCAEICAEYALATALRSAEFIFAVEAYGADWSWMASWFTADTS